ncbi:MAG: hypothetical protein JNM31_00735 [Flavobacteriales bacterium]|nr:hypothetical protein [Flavobacteriales bacterium]
MGRYLCTHCGLDFLKDLPVGFAVDHPMAIDRVTGELFNPTHGEYWIHGPLVEGFRSPSDRPFKIERIVHRSCSEVVVLNTLDFLYGHVLLKLFNAQYYLDHHPDKGLILILPRMYAWLVPRGVAEVWLVDIRLGEAHAWSTCIDAFVQDSLRQYDRVYLGKGYAHPEFLGVDIERFTGITPFNTERFDSLPRQVTFVTRVDRLWFRHPMVKLAWRVLNKLGLKRLVGPWFVADQDRMMRSVMKILRKAYPDIRFTITGLGDADPALGSADLRTRRMTDDVEREWCKAYSQSQVVLGVHGSNMILPTAFAAGCLEILPYDRYGNIVQDISVRYNDRMQLFLYRFVDEFASPRQVARHLISMFKHHALYRRDNMENIFPRL